jgi:hypothetical protein
MALKIRSCQRQHSKTRIDQVAQSNQVYGRSIENIFAFMLFNGIPYEIPRESKLDSIIDHGLRREMARLSFSINCCFASFRPAIVSPYHGLI